MKSVAPTSLVLPPCLSPYLAPFLLSLCTLSYTYLQSILLSFPLSIITSLPRRGSLERTRARTPHAHAHARRRPPGLRPPESLTSPSEVGNRSFWPSAGGATPFLSRERVATVIPGATLPAYSGLGLRPLSYGGKGVPPSKIEIWRPFSVLGGRIKKRLSAAPPSGHRREATASPCELAG